LREDDVVVLVFALAVGLVVGIALLVVDSSNKWTPALGERLAALKTERDVAERRTAEHEREIALAQRERDADRSLADAERRIARATARIEEQEAALNIREAELRQQESELEDRQRSVGERERELIATRAVPKRNEGLGAVDSDWWEKQLGPGPGGASPPSTPSHANAGRRYPTAGH
jgi:hypothetical protein